MNLRILVTSCALLTSVSVWAGDSGWKVTQQSNPHLLFSCWYKEKGKPTRSDMSGVVVDVVDAVLDDSGETAESGLIRITNMENLESSELALLSATLNPKEPNEIVYTFASKIGHVVVNTANPSQSYVSLPFGRGFYMNNCLAGKDIAHFSIAHYASDMHKKMMAAQSQKAAASSHQVETPSVTPSVKVSTEEDVLIQAKRASERARETLEQSKKISEQTNAISDEIAKLAKEMSETNQRIDAAADVEQDLEQAQKTVDQQLQAAEAAKKLQEAVDTARSKIKAKTKTSIKKSNNK